MEEPVVSEETKELIELYFAMESLTVYRNITTDPVVQAFIKVLSGLTPDKTFTEMYRNYHEFCALALDKNWPEHLFNLILADDNYFSRLMNKHGTKALNPELIYLVSRELAIIRKAGRIGSDVLINAIKALKDLKELKELDWGFWDKGLEKIEEITYNQNEINFWTDQQRQIVKEGLFHAESKAEWEYSVHLLADYYYNVGYGLCSEYLAFRWEQRGSRGELVGISQPDLVEQEQLIGLNKELDIINKNTEHFLDGYGGQNILLYGGRGTGKSSAVKSLLTKYSSRGLRMVELRKENLNCIEQIMEELIKFRQKFIIFIDDLSFEDMETEYKGLKASLEGRLTARLPNVLIYATSNRRHLIKESFSERQGDDVHVQDSFHEKLSLKDRFGITVAFPSTDQQRYLDIVEGLARQKGIKLPSDELRQMALRWELHQNGRSGRTAKQFIEYLLANRYNE